MDSGAWTEKRARNGTQPEGEPIKLVIPTLLQMGWVESPPYFCAATETARDVSTEYINTEMGTLPTHKFEKYDVDYATLPEFEANKSGFLYMVEVYVDDFMSLVILVSQEQL